MPVADDATMALLYSIISYDSIALSSKGVYSRPIVSHLRPVHLKTKYIKAGEIPPDPQTFYVSIFHLLRMKHEDGTFFKQEDSLFLIQQQRQQRTSLLDTTLFVPGDLFAFTDNEKKTWPVGYPDFYRFSLPLFSKDSLRAYIQRDHNCEGGCGGGSAYWLEKKDGVWQRIYLTRRWFN